MREMIFALACLAFAVAPSAVARAQATVVVRLEPRDVLGESVELELGQRGLAPLFVAPSSARDAGARATEARVEAQALGATAAIWIDAAPDGRTSWVRAVRADAPGDVSSPVPSAALRDDPRAVALVAAALVEELIARPPQAGDEARALDAPVTPPAAEDAGELPTSGPPRDHLYGWFATGGYLRTDPSITGGMSVRGGVGVSWPSGWRFGGTALFTPTGEGGEVSGQRVVGIAASGTVGVEGGLHVHAPGQIVYAGVHALVGTGRHVAREDALGDPMPWLFVLVGGAHVGFALPVGRTGEMGARIDADLWVEADRSVTGAFTLSVAWGWE